MMRSGILVLALTAGLTVSAQSVISAHSGTIHYTEGQVSLDGTPVQPKFGEFPEVKSGQVLAAQDGRAEILLTPGVFLRMAENSSFKMISNQLTNTRLEVQSGSAMIEVGELLSDNAITVVFHNADVSIAKRGLYRFDSDPARLRVYEGELNVVSASTDPMTVRRAHELVFGEPKLEAKSFDAKITDDFYRWSARRDEYVAASNISSAKTARDSGYSGMGCNGTSMMNSNYAPGTGMGVTPGTGGGSWAWNPWFGNFTYVPCGGTYMSPFGYGYFSPYTVGYMYGPYSPYAYGNGYPAGGVGSAVGRGTGVATTAASGTGIGRAAGFTGAGAAASSGSAGSRGGLGSGGGGVSSGGGASGGVGHAGGGGGGVGGGSAGRH